MNDEPRHSLLHAAHKLFTAVRWFVVTCGSVVYLWLVSLSYIKLSISV